MGQEDPLEYERETHSSILAWKIPQTEGTRWLQSMELRKVRNDLVNEHVHNGIDKEMERERECMGVWVCRNMCEKGNFSSVQFSSVAQSFPTLCNPMNRTMPGLPVHHQLPEFTQTHVHPVSDAIQPSHPLSSPSPPAFNLSQHQGLFQ